MATAIPIGTATTNAILAASMSQDDAIKSLVEMAEPHAESGVMEDGVFVQELPGVVTTSLEMHLTTVSAIMQREIMELRRAVEAHRRRIEHFNETGVTLPMLRAAFTLRAEEAKAEWERALKETVTQLNASMTNKVDRPDLADLDKRKVDWSSFKSTVLALTRSNIQAHVEEEMAVIKQQMIDEFKRIFEMDPSMRADMIEVSKLSRRVKLAEESSRHLAGLLEDGMAAKLAEVTAVLDQRGQEALSRFTSAAEKSQRETLVALERTQGILEGRIQHTLDTAADKYRANAQALEKSVDDRIARAHNELSENVENRLANLNAKVRKTGADATAALALAKTIEKTARDDAAVRDMKALVDSTAARADGLQAAVNALLNEVTELKKELAKVKAANATTTANLAVVQKLTTSDGTSSDAMNTLEKMERRQKAELAQLQQNVAADLRRVRTELTEQEKTIRDILAADQVELMRIRQTVSLEFQDVIHRVNREMTEFGARLAKSGTSNDERIATLTKQVRDLTAHISSNATHTENQLWRLQQQFIAGSKQAATNATAPQAVVTANNDGSLPTTARSTSDVPSVTSSATGLPAPGPAAVTSTGRKLKFAHVVAKAVSLARQQKAEELSKAESTEIAAAATTTASVTQEAVPLLSQVENVTRSLNELSTLLGAASMTASAQTLTTSVAASALPGAGPASSDPSAVALVQRTASVRFAPVAQVNDGGKMELPVTTNTISTTVVELASATAQSPPTSDMAHDNAEVQELRSTISSMTTELQSTQSTLSSMGNKLVQLMQIMTESGPEGWTIPPAALELIQETKALVSQYQVSNKLHVNGQRIGVGPSLRHNGQSSRRVLVFNTPAAAQVLNSKLPATVTLAAAGGSVPEASPIVMPVEAMGDVGDNRQEAESFSPSLQLRKQGSLLQRVPSLRQSQSYSGLHGTFMPSPVRVPRPAGPDYNFISDAEVEAGNARMKQLLLRQESVSTKTKKRSQEIRS